MNVFIDTSPLQNANSIRGVGAYTRFLTQELEKIEDENFQLVHSKKEANIIHYPFFDLFFHTLPIHLFSKPKVVVTIHDVIPLLFPKYYPVGIKGSIRLALQRFALRNVDAIITDSEASKKDVIKYLSVPSNKIHVVYLAGNPNIKFQSASWRISSKFKEKYQFPDKYILYVGDINYNKNIPELMKSLTFIDENIHLVCVGKNFQSAPIIEWIRIEEAVSKNQLSDRVHFITELGSDANEALSAMYSGAVCYVQPSLYEGFGLPVLEALQCETPVVCAKNSSLIEVGGEVVEFVQPTAKGIATGVMNIMKKGKTETWKKAVQEHLKKFSWKKTAEETLSIYSLFK